MMKSLFQIFFFAAMLTAASASFAQPTKTSAGSGAWTTASTWIPSGVPATGDNVVIAAGHTVTTTGITRTGAVTVNGTLSSSGNFTAGSLSGTGTVTVTGATMRILSFGSLNTNTTFSGVITGKARFRKTGTGTFTFSGSGANTYSGSTEIQGGGTMRLGAANRIPDGSSLQLCGNSTFDLNGFNETIGDLNSTSGTCGSTFDHIVTNSSATPATLTIQLLDGGYGYYSGSITGKLNLVVSGGGNSAQQDLDGANTYTGTTLVSGGLLNILATAALPSATNITITSPGQVALNADATCNTLTLGSLLQFAGTTHGSTSSAASNKNDTYFSSTATGVLTATNGNVVKTSTKTGNWTVASVWSPSGVPATGDSVIIAATHTVTTTGITRTGAVTVNGTLSSSGNFTAGSLSGTGTVTVTGATMRILSFGSLNTNTTFSGVITGKARFRKTGTGTFTYSGSGANTYSGNTEIQGGGTMRLGAANRIPDGSSLRLCGNSTFDLNGFNETIGDLSSISGTCGSTFDHIVTNSSATPATLTIQLLDGGYGSYSGSITGNLNLVVSGGGNSAQQDLDGANTYTGTTLVSGGLLNIMATAALPSATNITITSPGQVALNADATCNTLTLGVTLQAPATYGSSASSADISNDTYFDVFGTGVLTVSTGAGSFKTSTKTGNWTDASVWSPSGVPVTGDNVVIAAGHTVTAAASITRSGSVRVNGTLSTNSAFTAGSLAGTGTVTVTGATKRTLSFGSLNTNTTFSGVITGNAHFRKTGTGALTLSGSGANTYSGKTEIQGGGTMRLGAANRIPDGSSLQLCGNSTFDLKGFNETIGDLTSITGSCGLAFDHIVTNSSATPATLTIQLLDGGYGAYSGSITGNLNLVVSGDGNSAQQDLDGANTYTGTTTVSGGILNIMATAALPSATNITITSPGQVALNADATCNTLTLGATPQIPGTYGSTASSATTQDDTYFDVFGTGVLTVSNSLVNSPVERASSELGSAQELPNNFDVKVLGNPSTSMFILKIESNNFDEKVTLKIVDISGRIVEVKQNLYVGAMVELGMDYKAGIYFVEAIQGEQRKVIKLFKAVKN